MNAFDYCGIDLFLNQIFKPFHSGVLTTNKNQILHVKYQNLLDLGTLSAVTQSCHKYLQPMDGDIIITNDPYSGGSHLFTVYLILGINAFEKGSADLLMGMKVQFKPQVRLAQHIDQEGLRIPPTPIVQKGKINKEILAAISQHPERPDYFAEYITQAVEDLKAAHQNFKVLSETFGYDWSKNFIRDYLKYSHQCVLTHMNELSVGEEQVEFEVEKNTLLKLRIATGQDKIVFDFTGTQESSSLNLTDSATLGTCTGVLLGLLDQDIPVNSGLFDAIELVAPTGSMVNAKFPKPVFAGIMDGTSLVANVALKLFGQIDAKKKKAGSGFSRCAMSLKFSPQLQFFETSEAGIGASSTSVGTHGLNLWQRTHLSTSIEEIERRYPLLVKSFSFRSDSGGDGQYKGGNGTTKVIQVKENCTLTWIVIEPENKPEGLQGGKTADPAEIYIQLPNQKKEKLSYIGERPLVPGSLVIVNSSGGGGYGLPEKEA